MKKLLLFLMLLTFARADWPPLSPYIPYNFYPFEHVAEANGLVVVGGAAYKTSIRLDGDQKNNGDSSFVGFVTGANGPTNCNTPGDTLCQRHRGYTLQRFRGHVLGDTLAMTGIAMQCPCWIQFKWRYSNMPLHHHNTGEDDWDSPATALDDTSDNGNQPVTLGRDSLGYIFIEHAPLFDSTFHTYQASPANDPAGLKRMAPNQWHIIQWYFDDSANGYSIVWADGYLESAANVLNRNGTLAQFHAGLYCSPAVATGSVWNDNLLIVHVADTNEAILNYMTTPPAR